MLISNAGVAAGEWSEAEVLPFLLEDLMSSKTMVAGPAITVDLTSIATTHGFPGRILMHCTPFIACKPERGAVALAAEADG